MNLFVFADSMEQIVCSLERGTLIQKFYPRRKPEKKTLMLRRETRQVRALPRVRDAKLEVSNRIFSPSTGYVVISDAEQSGQL